MIEPLQIISIFIGLLSILPVFYYLRSTKKLKEDAKDLYQDYQIVSTIDDLYVPSDDKKKAKIKPIEKDDEIIEKGYKIESIDTTNREELYEYQQSVESLLALYAGYRDYYEQTWNRLLISASASIVLISLVLLLISSNFEQPQLDIAISIISIAILSLISISLLYAYKGAKSLKEWENYNRRLDSQLTISDYEHISDDIKIQDKVIHKQIERLTKRRANSIRNIALLIVFATAGVGYVIAGLLGAGVLFVLTLAIILLTKQQNEGVY